MREIVRDLNGQPVENLCTNPSFERAVAGSTVVRRNLATNPSFERAVAGTTIVRRNLYSNPGSEVVRSVQNAGSGQGTAARATARSHSGVASTLIKATSGSFGAQTENLPVIPGRTYTFSMWQYIEASEGAALPNWALGRNGYGASNVTMRIDPATPAGLNRWYRLYWTWTANEGATFYRPYFTWNDYASTVYIDDLLFEERPALLPQFDGNTPNDRGIAYEWEGVANASPSVAKAAVVEVRRNQIVDPRLTRLVSWSSEATVTRTVVSTGMQLDIPADTAGGTRLWNQSQFAAAANAPLSAAVLIEVPAGFPAVRVSLERRIYYGSGTASDSVSGAAVQVEPGTVVRLTVDAQSTRPDASGGQILVNVSAGVNAGLARRLIVREAIAEHSTTVNGPFFDGNTTPDVDLAPAWTGTENVSASVLYGLASPQIQQYTGRIVYGTPRGELRIVPDVNATNEGSGYGAIVYSNDRFKAGTTYTALATLRLDSPITGALDPLRALRLYVARGALAPAVAAQIPNVAGSHTVRITFAVPSSGSLDLRVGHGGLAGSGNLYVERLTIVEGPYSGPHFDGDTADDSGIAYSWEGTPHGSQSIARATVVEVRRNLFPDPQATSTAGWSNQASSGGSSALTAETGATPVGSTFIRATITAEPPTWARVQRLTSGIVAGLTYSRSVWVRASVSGRTLELRGQWADSSGAGIAEVPGTVTVTSVAGEWHRLEAVGVAPAGAISLRLLVDSRNAGSVVGTTFDVTGALVEASPTVGAFFTGAASPDSDLAASWMGVENNSASVLSGIRGNGVTSQNNATSVLSNQWSARGRTSLRMIPTRDAGGEGWAVVAGSTEGLGPFIPGRTYTVLGRLYMPSAQLTDATNARRIQLVSGPNAGSWTGTLNSLSTKAPNAAGQATLRLVGAVHSSAVWAQVRLSSGSGAGVGDVYWDEVAIIEGDYKGPYLDGDIPGCIWRGTPHASTAIGYPQLVALQAA